MARDKHTGAKTTSTKAFRQHKKSVAEAIRKHGNAATDADATPMSPAMIARWDSTFSHMHRASKRFWGQS
jgi:hypothetical protein